MPQLESRYVSVMILEFKIPQKTTWNSRRSGAPTGVNFPRRKTSRSGWYSWFLRWIDGSTLEQQKSSRYSRQRNGQNILSVTTKDPERYTTLVHGDF
ncbi:hypothetical protein JTB14_033767 [Gonioctena quinquepunctata]|nr:hypothetical protein JTB14_033767 [Gonioctena quinquepunctata]